MGLIDKQYLDREATRRFSSVTKEFSSRQLFAESKRIDKHYDVFLSHSYLDAIQVRVLKALIEEKGLSVYVDWIEDYELNRGNVNKETAEIIRHRMKNCDTLFYAFSENCKKSKWMPWELGYFDGYNGNVALIPIKENFHYRDYYQGIEFVSLYPYITITDNDLGISTGYINESQDIYVTFDEWKIGKKPFKR